MSKEQSLSEAFMEWKLGIIPGVTPSLEETMAALKAQWEKDHPREAAVNEECKL